MATDQLTRAHRRAQLRNGSQAVAASRVVWRLLNIRDLDASTAQWLRAQLPILRRYSRRSAVLAATYLDAYRTAQVGAPGTVIQAPYSQDAAAASMQAMGPAAIKDKIRRGIVPEVAWRQAMADQNGAVMRLVQRAGRDTIDLSVAADSTALGYRRVTGPDPCAFCAMLASRGPAYASKAGATAVGLGRRTGRAVREMGTRYHDHCKCTAEPLYRGQEWAPDDREQRFIDLYEKSYVSGDWRETLRQMRRAL